MREELSVVIPTYNMAMWLEGLVKSVVLALNYAKITEFEIIIVDDGSNEWNVETLASLKDKYNLKILEQKNLGRWRARQNGIQVAKYENVLLIDSRVRIDPKAIAWWRFDAPKDLENFTSHVNYDEKSNIIGLFWSGIESLAWIAYWIYPRDKILNQNNFDFFPKGTTCFLSTKEEMIKVYSETSSSTEELKEANDDTLLLKSIARQSGIFLSPKYASTYIPRNSIRDFIKHVYHRGKVFADGHIFNVSIWGKTLLMALLIFTSAAFLKILSYALLSKFALIMFCILMVLVILVRMPLKKFSSLILIIPLFSVVYLFGIFQGIRTVLQNKVRKLFSRRVE